MTMAGGGQRASMAMGARTERLGENSNNESAVSHHVHLTGLRSRMRKLRRTHARQVTIDIRRLCRKMKTPPRRRGRNGRESVLSWSQCARLNGPADIRQANHPRLAIDLAAFHSLLPHGLCESRVWDADQSGRFSEWPQPGLVLIWRSLNLALKLLMSELHCIAWRMAQPIGQRAERQASIGWLLLPCLIDFGGGIEGDRSRKFTSIHLILPFCGHRPADY